MPSAGIVRWKWDIILVISRRSSSRRVVAKVVF
jgi:hypothetical protein